DVLVLSGRLPVEGRHDALLYRHLLPFSSWCAPTIDRLDDWLAHRARTHADRPALITTVGAVTYAELDHGAEATARRLAALGVGEGDRVATTLPPGRAFAELLHAVPRLGASL